MYLGFKAVIRCGESRSVVLCPSRPIASCTDTRLQNLFVLLSGGFKYMRELGSWQDKAVIFVPLCQSAEGKERRANLDWLLKTAAQDPVICIAFHINTS